MTFRQSTRSDDGRPRRPLRLLSNASLRATRASFASSALRLAYPRRRERDGGVGSAIVARDADLAWFLSSSGRVARTVPTWAGRALACRPDALLKRPAPPHRRRLAPRFIRPRALCAQPGFRRATKVALSGRPRRRFVCPNAVARRGRLICHWVSDVAHRDLRRSDALVDS